MAILAQPTTKGRLRIFNLALGYVGIMPLVSELDEGTKASACVQFYPEALESVLDDHDWNCAVVRRSLTQEKESPEYGYSFKFKRPKDCVLIRSIEGLSKGEYQVEGDFILCDQESINISFTSKDIKAEVLSQHVRDLVAVKLAFYISPTLKANVKDSAILDQLYDKYFIKARIIDGKESIRTAEHEDSWIEQFN